MLFYFSFEESMCGNSSTLAACLGVKRKRNRRKSSTRGRGEVIIGRIQTQIWKSFLHRAAYRHLGGDAPYASEQTSPYGQQRPFLHLLPVPPHHLSHRCRNSSCQAPGQNRRTNTHAGSPTRTYSKHTHARICTHCSQNALLHMRLPLA